MKYNKKILFFYILILISKYHKRIFGNNSVLDGNAFQFKRNVNLYNILLLPNPNIKEEFLFSLKSKNEILLSQIKTSQLKLLSNLKNNKSNTNNNNSLKNKKSKLNFFKDILLELKNNLSEILNQKILHKNYLETGLNKKKKNIYKKIFINEKIQKCSGKDEMAKLKILNFEIENEIEKINFLINNKLQIIKYLKIVNIFPEQNRELFYNNQKKNNKEIDEILKSEKNLLKEILNKMVIENNLQNNDIEKCKNDIRKIKQKIEVRKNINQSDIIYEDSLENKIITSFSNFYNKSKGDIFKNNILSEINKDNKNIYINNNSNNILNLKLNINLNINNNKIISQKIENSLENSLSNDE